MLRWNRAQKKRKEFAEMEMPTGKTIQTLRRQKGLTQEQLAAVSYTHLDVYKRQLRTKDDTVQLIKRLKKRGYGVFYLSNISWDVLEMLQQRKFWQLFDGGVASCEVKLTKPDLRIYLSLIHI